MKKHSYLCSIVDETCYFCGISGIVRFKEHYLFCPNCEAIYTNCILIEKNCKHITKGIIPSKLPILCHIKPYVKETSDSQECSVCGAAVVADGW